MAQIDLVELVRQAILTGAMVLLPVLSVAFLSSLFVGLLQAATGIHEPLVVAPNSTQHSGPWLR